MGVFPGAHAKQRHTDDRGRANDGTQQQYLGRHGSRWTATSPVAWITVTSGGMSGLGSVNVTVGTTTTPRTSTFTVAGQIVSISAVHRVHDTP